MKTKNNKLFKALGITVAIIVIVCLAISCDSNKNENDKYSIVCTIFPEYDFVMNILGENSDLFDVTLLINNGTDMHSYQPTVADIAKITDCQLFVYNGSNSQNWVNNILKNINSKKTTAVSLVNELGDSLCSQPTDLHDHDHEHDSDYDEHIWLSLKNAQSIVDILCREIVKIDPENSEIYRNNSEKYSSALSQLDEDFNNALETAKHNTLIFADRFPFVYLLEDYGIEYYAAFSGCTTESDAGVKTILSLSEKLKALGLPALMVIETSDQTVANTVIEQSKISGIEILTLNSCQSITKKQIDDGASYIDIMKTNLDNIKKALSCEG